MKKIKILTTTLNTSLIVLILTVLVTISTHAQLPSIIEGATLNYKWVKVSSGAGGTQTGNATFQILVANQTTIITRATGTTTVTLTIKYQNGIPTYTDRLEALIYLPPECITQSLQGNLNWIRQIKAETQTATVINGTAQLQEFTVEAGTFQSLNITLNLAGWMYGNLTLIYDVNSGILIYEQWVPEYGDIIIQFLSALTYATKPPQNVALSILLTATTFATPIAIIINKTGKALKKRRLKNKQLSQNSADKIFLKKMFYLILTGAIFTSVSTLLPWSQLAKTQMHLPMSLPTALIAPTTLIPSTVSLIAHSATILAWIGIAFHLYTNKKLVPQLAILVSSILSFASVAILVYSGWTLSLGASTMIVGGVLTILGLIAAKVKRARVAAI